jgi:hypothetical protein
MVGQLKGEEEAKRWDAMKSEGGNEIWVVKNKPHVVLYSANL